MAPSGIALDLAILGRRIRHARKAKGMTLGDLAAVVERAPSLLSQIETGKREPRLTLLQSLATALEVDITELMKREAPSQRAALEVELEHAQRSSLYASLGLPTVTVGSRLPTELIESLVGLHHELARRVAEQAATPEEARRANTELRRQMRDRGNYFAELEKVAAAISTAVGYAGGPLTERGVEELTSYFGFTLHRVADLPRATRSIIDLRNRRIYLPVRTRTGHDPRTIVLQTVGHVALDHHEPASYADFLSQRVEVNYFAAALLMPEAAAVGYLQRAKAKKALSIEDLRDVFAVSYESAAHRFTNLATHHLGLPVHFMRVGEDGVIYKAYENDGVTFPTDVTGAIEGQVVCRYWGARAAFTTANRYTTHYQYTDIGPDTFWCAAHVAPMPEGEFAIDVGVPYAHSKWFRGRDTTNRARSSCPDPSCCRKPPADLAARWSTRSWPSARVHSHLLAALPPGTFPGVDQTDVYQFLQRHAPNPVEIRTKTRP